MNEYKEVVVIHNDIKMQIKQIDSLERAIILYMKYEDDFISCTNGIEFKICSSLKECNEFFKNI
jgi:hypothetical protein